MGNACIYKHGLYLYFFGGSPFVWFGVFLSGLKISFIPMMRILIKNNIYTWKCDYGNARRYIINDLGDGDRGQMMGLIYEYHWETLLNDIDLVLNGL